jgi:hypothetical protein
MISFRESNIKLAIKNLFLKRKKDILVIEPRFGLGDSIVCNGIIRELAKSSLYRSIYFVCPNPKNYHSVVWMFLDLPNVYVIAGQNGRQARQLSGFLNAQYLALGVKDIEKHYDHWDQYFYDQASVPLEKRWESSHIPEGPNSSTLYEKLNPLNEEYILVCRHQSGGVPYELQIPNPNKHKVIEVYPASTNFFDWIKLIRHAKEIHAIDTSLVHLVESYFYKNPKETYSIFLHLANVPKIGFTTKLPWVLVRY